MLRRVHSREGGDGAQFAVGFHLIAYLLNLIVRGELEGTNYIRRPYQLQGAPMSWAHRTRNAHQSHLPTT